MSFNECCSTKSCRTTTSSLHRVAKIATVALFCLVVLGTVFAAPAEATHFRYGHLTWVKGTGNTVKFTLTDAFRRNGYPGTGGDGFPVTGNVITETIGTTNLAFGDGAFTPTLKFKVTGYDVANNWINAVACDPADPTNSTLTVSHTYASPNNAGAAWVAQIDDCCRISTLINAPDGNYRVQTLVNLATDTQSPVSSLPPIIPLATGGIRSFFVPAADPDPTVLSWRLATLAESQIATQPIIGANALGVNSLTGLATWNTTGTVVGSMYACQIVIEEKTAGGALLTRVGVDFIILITSTPSGSPPVVDPSSPACGHVFAVDAGGTVSFTVKASDPDAFDLVTLNTPGLPPGSTMTPALPTSGNPVSSVFSWTPTAAQVGTWVVTFSFTDLAGNQILCSYTVNVAGCVLTIACPADKTIECDQSTDPSNTGTPTYTSSAACGAVTVTHSDVVTAGTCPQTYTISRTWKATAASGHVATCVQIINVHDTTAPTVACPADKVLACGESTDPANTGSATGTDNCGSVTITHSDEFSAANCTGKAGIDRTWKATDQCGNFANCVQHITFTDVTAPVVTCPPDKALQCGETADPANTGFATATDNCGGSPAISHTDAATAANCTGIAGIDRTWKATDGCGNFATCVQHITYTDATAPLVICPADAVLQCGESTDPANTGYATATDNCGGSPSISFTDDATAANCTGKAGIDRTWKATDACGNSATCVQSITFTDATAPVVTCPADKVLQCGESTDPVNTGSATATDNCGGSPTITHSDEFSAANCTGKAGIDRTWKATDGCGNLASCVQHITFEDVTPPSITCPADFSVECLADVPVCDPASATASDNCGSVSVACSDGPLVGGACGGTITRTFTATDGCGNTNSCSQTITVDDNTAPVFTACPASLTFECAGAVPACDASAAAATDNCDPSVDITCARTDNGGSGCANSSLVYTDTYTATDDCGNSSTCSRTITVDDNTAPVFTTCPASLTFECAGSVPACDASEAAATDNCDASVDITCSRTSNGGSGCANSPLIYTDTYTATDDCGNSSTCSRTITVDDDIAPVLSGCPGNLMFACVGDVPQSCDVPGISALDNCDGSVAVTCARTSNGGSGCPNSPLVYTDTYTATDACGNSSQCSRTITVIDNVPPSFTCPANLSVKCLGDVPPCAFGGFGALDNCGGTFPVTCSRADNGGGGCPGSPLVITDTYSSTDNCGNTATCTRTITVVDDVKPVLSGCPSNQTIQCLGEIPACSPSVTAQDNCDGPVQVSCSDGQLTGGPCGGTVTRTYRATDHCGNTSTCTQTFTVNDNVAPVIACPPNITVQRFLDLPPCDAGDVLVTDNCGNTTVTCDRTDVGGVGCVNTSVTVTYTYTAKDGCGNTATCQRVVTVVRPDCPLLVSTAGPSGTITAWSGSTVVAPVSMDSLRLEIGALDLLLGYDRRAVSVLNVEKGPALSGWEYFTYRLSEQTIDGVPVGLVRLVAVADMNDGSAHPPTGSFMPQGAIANLTFAVSADRQYVNQSVPIASYRFACTDNTVQSRSGGTTLVEADVASGSCGSELKGQVVPGIRFQIGRIGITEPSLVTGDINLNNVAYEVGDAVLLVNYFTHDQSVFSSNPEFRALQIAASDVNHDGTVLSVADLIYLTRIITGDAMPLTPGAKLSPYAASATALVRTENGAVHVATQSTTDLGGLLLTFRYQGLSVGQPSLSSAAASLRLQSHADNGQLKVLVYAWDTGVRINAGANEILTIPTSGDGTIELADVQMSDASGALLSASAAKAAVPDAYALLQNYPNPFNAGTVMPIALKNASEWSLTVYNVAGQVVRSFQGSDEAGIVNVAWDGRANDGSTAASGMYFYRVTTPTFSATRKMTLLK